MIPPPPTPSRCRCSANNAFRLAGPVRTTLKLPPQFIRFFFVLLCSSKKDPPELRPVCLALVLMRVLLLCVDIQFFFFFQVSVADVVGVPGFLFWKEFDMRRSLLSACFPVPVLEVLATWVRRAMMRSDGVRIPVQVCTCSAGYSSLTYRCYCGLAKKEMQRLPMGVARVKTLHTLVERQMLNMVLNSILLEKKKTTPQLPHTSKIWHENDKNIAKMS